MNSFTSGSMLPMTEIPEPTSNGTCQSLESHSSLKIFTTILPAHSTGGRCSAHPERLLVATTWSSSLVRPHRLQTLLNFDAQSNGISMESTYRTELRVRGASV